MSFLDVDLENTPDIEVMPEGEAEVRCIKAELTESNAGNDMVVLTMEPLNPPAGAVIDDIKDYLVLPHGEMTEKQQIRRKKELKAACEAFGVDFSGGGFDTEHFEGSTGWVVLSQEESPDYGAQNRVDRYVTQA